MPHFFLQAIYQLVIEGVTGQFLRVKGFYHRTLPHDRTHGCLEEAIKETYHTEVMLLAAPFLQAKGMSPPLARHALCGNRWRMMRWPCLS